MRENQLKTANCWNLGVWQRGAGGACLHQQRTGFRRQSPNAMLWPPSLNKHEKTVVVAMLLSVVKNLWKNIIRGFLTVARSILHPNASVADLLLVPSHPFCLRVSKHASILVIHSEVAWPVSELLRQDWFCFQSSTLMKSSKIDWHHF